MVKTLRNELGEFDSIYSEDESTYSRYTTDLNNLPLDNVEPKGLNLIPKSKNGTSKRMRIQYKKELKYLNSFRKIPNDKIPKKEYVRCMLIRGHKRMIRQSKKLTPPKKTLNKVNVYNFEQVDCWNSLCENVKENREILEEIAKTEKGPATDGKAKRGTSEKPERSFNNGYCREYFASAEVEYSYRMYVDVLFTENDLNAMCNKFKITCCNPEMNHDVEVCKVKWASLREYLKFILIEELRENSDLAKGADEESLDYEEMKNRDDSNQDFLIVKL